MITIITVKDLVFILTQVLLTAVLLSVIPGNVVPGLELPSMQPCGPLGSPSSHQLTLIGSEMGCVRDGVSRGANAATGHANVSNTGHANVSDVVRSLEEAVASLWVHPLVHP